jgi:putative colanic acid biosynthesis UDP-glucose lipid carrier transferase
MASIVAIVDFTGEGADLARRIAPSNLADVRLIGVFSSEDPTLSQKGIGDLLALSRLFRIDDIFVLISDRAVNEASDKIASVLRRLGTVPANVRLCRLPLQLERVPLREPEVLHGVSTLTIHRCPLRSWSGVAKRAEDIIVGVAALPLLLPVMAVAAIAIKCDSPGPVLFRQARYGFNNNVITVLKFRTMKHRHGQEPDGWVRQATRNDDRVTRVGRILRRTSIDELPQIFNVLRGNMALVGPRPHAVPHNEQYAALIDNYLGRHRVQPGMTGWAQVNGLRGETDTIEKMQKRVEHDLYYIEHWSIALDLRIIFMTAVQGLLHREAY